MFFSSGFDLDNKTMKKKRTMDFNPQSCAWQRDVLPTAPCTAGPICSWTRIASSSICKITCTIISLSVKTHPARYSVLCTHIMGEGVATRKISPLPHTSWQVGEWGISSTKWGGGEIFRGCGGDKMWKF